MADALDSKNSVAEILETLPAEETQHMLRVGSLVDSFAKELRFYGVVEKQPEEHTYYGRAAFYHDIGKAWIPHSILTKPDRLTEEEKLVMCDHPVFAQRLFDRIRRGFLSGMPDYLIQPAGDCAVYHHEWWDGTGYPYGMRHDGIPLIARITSICDAYDAMTSDRVYRKGHSHDLACKELLKYAGRQFDPRLVRIFSVAEINPDAATDKLLSYLQESYGLVFSR